jgi:hypothetical protein
MKDDGGPAAEKSLRDHFAGMALQGFLADPEDCGLAAPEKLYGPLVHAAYALADAMLAERAKRFKT